MGLGGTLIQVVDSPGCEAEEWVEVGRGMGRTHCLWVFFISEVMNGGWEVRLGWAGDMLLSQAGEQGWVGWDRLILNLGTFFGESVGFYTILF